MVSWVSFGGKQTGLRIDCEELVRKVRELDGCMEVLFHRKWTCCW